MIVNSDSLSEARDQTSRDLTRHAPTSNLHTGGPVGGKGSLTTGFYGSLARPTHRSRGNATCLGTQLSDGWCCLLSAPKRVALVDPQSRPDAPIGFEIARRNIADPPDRSLSQRLHPSRWVPWRCPFACLLTHNGIRQAKNPSLPVEVQGL